VNSSGESKMAIKGIDEIQPNLILVLFVSQAGKRRPDHPAKLKSNTGLTGLLSGSAFLFQV
jgi:hypothetical protein